MISFIRHKQYLNFPALCILLGLAACSPRSQNQDVIHLTSTLASPNDVTLNWNRPSGEVTGYVVEFATDPKGQFIILQFLKPDQTQYTHPKLMPKTSFYYRIRPFFGRTTQPLELRVSPKLSNEAHMKAFERGEDYRWGESKTEPRKETTVFSMKGGDADKAVPSNLQATYMPVTVSGFLLRWNDHANDEDGYLVETRSEGQKDFVVYEQFPPNINAAGFGIAPPVRKTLVRIRGFYFGPASNMESKTTGPDEPV
ncbi:MAG: hypothetical protein JWL63_261 [Rhodocyclales bacterium]|nr:hypothetical protein [Rhodocyclales bacterium]